MADFCLAIKNHSAVMSYRKDTKALTKIRRTKTCLRCPPKIMSFSQLPAVKKTSFLVGISIKFRPFLFQHSGKMGVNYLAIWQKK